MLLRLNNDLKDAMRHKETLKLDVIRMLKTNIKNCEIELKKELNDEEIISLIQKSIKGKEQANALFLQGNRPDLVENSEKEIEILKSYLPKALSEEELISIIDNTIATLNATSIKEMGAVIKSVKEQVGSRSDGSIISALVKQKLS
ncbi:MAG TPA: GatB/YqeY domain-containing protein [Candidatus Cloacimonadota bacterium]|nr:GatB/YqeY domain-containing protein [Candidatus Cloacimonadota bacterium]HPK41388.1 GatB/YqeY domain-containing protein [Candidatus Cloacimonadota bacterium]